jgi:hypothetical protein
MLNFEHRMRIIRCSVSSRWIDRANEHARRGVSVAVMPPL